MKKLFAFLFIPFFAFSCLFDVFAESSGDGEGSINVKVKNGYFTSSSPYVEFTYDDAYFESSPDVLSAPLAKMSISLSSFAYSATSMKDCFDQMGCEIIGRFNYDRVYTKNDCGYTAYTVARKKAGLSDGTYWIYFVAVRGTSGYEWYSNFEVGTGTDHEGFTDASNDILKNLETVIDTPKELNKILITGHSRGAAASNLVAHSLIHGSELVESGNVYAYTFACPTVTRSPSKDDAIFNFNNPGDIVPIMPFPGWGYSRHGTDITLPTDASTLSSLNAIMKKKTGVSYTGKTDFSELEKSFVKWCPTVDDYYSAGKYSISPYECVQKIADCLISGDMSNLMSIASPFLTDSDARNALTSLYGSFSAIGIGHAHYTYICWINAAYPSDLGGISVLPYNGEYDGKPHPICVVSGEDEASAVRFSEDGKSWSFTVPEVKDAGEYTFYISVSGKNGTAVSEKYTSYITPELIDVSGTKLEESSFAYDGSTHTPSLGTVPVGLDYTLDGELSGTDAGSYTLKIKWKSKDANTSPSEEVTELKWRINKASYDMSNAKWDYSSPFKYNGKEHAVSLTGLPDGVTPIYSGTCKATEKGSYTAKAEFEYDSKNYYSPSVDELEWAINGSFLNTSVVAVFAGVLAAVGAFVIVKKAKK